METLRETLILREAISEEVDTLVDFVGRYYAFDGIPFHPFDVRRSLLQLVSDPRLGKAFILQVNGISAGYAILTIGFDHEVGGRIGTITDFYLDPAFRRRGIGTETLARLEKEAIKLGLEALELQVVNDNGPAKGLYRKMGFQAADRIPMCKRITKIRESHEK
jgi:ribosomal protein S18 acetylase RimI-like enzyme